MLAAYSKAKYGVGIWMEQLIWPLAAANDEENTTDGTSPACWERSWRGLQGVLLLWPIFYFVFKKMCTSAHMRVCTVCRIYSI